MIVQRGGKWCLLSRDGSKNLGCYATRAGAQARERQVNMFKHAKEQLGFIDEDVRLMPDETVGEFMMDLREALENAFDFHVDQWWIRDVASDWLVVCCWQPGEDENSCGEPMHYRIDWSRAATGAFTFGDVAEPVEPVTVWEPMDDPDGTENQGEELEVTTTGDVPAVPGAGKPKKKGAKGPLLAKKATATLPTVGGVTTVSTPDQPSLATAGQEAKVGPYSAKPKTTSKKRMSKTAKKGKYANMGGKDGGNTDIGTGGEAELPVATAGVVENAIAAQRENLPDSAFALVVAHNGTTWKHFPHHTADGALDVARLREWLSPKNRDALHKGTQGKLAEAIAHMEDHARELRANESTRGVAAELLEGAHAARVKFSLKELFDGDAYEIKLEAVTTAQLSEAEISKQYVAVYEGRGAVGGKINANRRLYGKGKMQENVGKLAERIAAGEAIWGEADHPESSPRLLASCTKLLGIGYDEQTGDVRIRVGVVPTTAGQDVAVLMNHEMRIGVSTRSIGYARDMTMGEGDEYFGSNAEHDGKDYKRIDDFEIQAFDLVRQPSAGTFLGESITAEQLAIEAQRIKSQTTADQENEMTKDQFEAEMKKTTPEQLQAIAPDLYAAVAEKVSADVAAKLAEQVSATAGADAAKLAEELKTQNGKVAVLEQFVSDLKAERDATALDSAKRKLMDEKLAGVDKADACRRYLGIHYVGDGKAALESIDALIAQFKATFAEHLSPDRIPAGRPRTANGAPAWMNEDADILGNSPMTRAPQSAK